MKKSDIIFIFIILVIGIGVYSFLTNKSNRNVVTDLNNVKTQMPTPEETPLPTVETPTNETPKPDDRTPDGDIGNNDQSNGNTTPDPKIEKTPETVDKRLFNPEGAIMFKNIALFIEEGRVEFMGKANLENGDLEILVATPKGRDYESLILAEIDPEMFQAAMLAIGLEFGEGGPEFAGDSTPPVGDGVCIYIEWIDKSSRRHKIRAEDAILQPETMIRLKPTHWVFTGSHFVKNEYSGNQEFGATSSGTIISVFHDPDAIIDHPWKKGECEQLWKVNDAVVPPIETNVKVIIQSIKHQEKDNEGAEQQ